MGVKYNKGTISMASALRPTGAQPLDNRTIVENYNDLLDISTFNKAVYEGMKVFVLETKKWYTLIDVKNINNIDSWEELLYKKELNDHANDNIQHITSEERTLWNKAKSDIDLFLKDATINGEVVDTLKELQEYINEDESGATIMIENVNKAQNTANDAIDKIEETNKNIEAINLIIGSGITNSTLTETIEEIDLVTATALTGLEKKTDKTNENLISLNNEIVLIKQNYITGVTSNSDFITFSKKDNNVTTDIIIGDFVSNNGISLTNNVKEYVLTEIDKVKNSITAHTSNDVIHVDADDKTKWNKVDEKVDTSAYTTHVEYVDNLLNAQAATIENLTKRIEELEAILLNGTIINTNNISQFAVVDVVSTDNDMTITKENGKITISLNGISNENFSYSDSDLILEKTTDENGEVTLNNEHIVSGDTIVVYDDNEKIIAEHVIIDEEIENGNIKIITKNDYI